MLGQGTKVRPGKRLGDVGAAIQELAEFHDYGVVREMSGHSVGCNLHEAPHVEHFGRRGRGLVFPVSTLRFIRASVCLSGRSSRHPSCGLKRPSVSWVLIPSHYTGLKVTVSISSV